MDTKPWWQSKTIWGALIAAVATGLKIFHVNVELPPDLADQILNALTLVGTIIAIVGRAKAQTAVTLTKDDAGPRIPPDRLVSILFLASALSAVAFSVGGCAQGPVYPNSAAAKVGADFSSAAAAAIQAFVEHRDGKTDMAWSLSKGLTAYQTFVESSADIKSLVKAWTGNTGDSQKLADKLARIFAESSQPPEVKTAALVHVAQSVAQDKGP